MKREKWIDTAKGILMLPIIAYHFSGGQIGTVSIRFFSGFTLTMYFLLSGYTMKRKPVTAEYLAARFRRLMVPYFITCAAVLATDIFNLFVTGGASIPAVTASAGKDLVRSFFASGTIMRFGTVELGIRIGAIWFLPAMFFAVVFFQLLLQKTEDDRILGFSSAVIALAGYITGRFLWLPFSLQAGMFAVFFLWIGYEVRKHELLSGLRWFHYAAALLCLLTGIYFGYSDIGFSTANIKDLLISLPVGLSGCLLVYLIAKADTKGVVFSYIGRESLTVLCVHLYSMEALSLYFNRLQDLIQEKAGLSDIASLWVRILMEILFAFLGAFVIDRLKTAFGPAHDRLLAFKEEKLQRDKKNRDHAIDTAKGIFILAMLVGHFSLDTLLRDIIYSCHMMAFVVFSGVFYNGNRSYPDSLKSMAKRLLLPYGIFVAARIVLSIPDVSWETVRQTVAKYVIGMSYAVKILPSSESVGPVYFILLLFMTRLIYMTVDKLTANRKQLDAAVFILSLFGLYLGHEELFLPWSIDIACYALIFYHLGRICREKQVFTLLKQWNSSYFILTPVWAYMIYSGSMEIGIRNYGKYGLVVLGAMAGILTVYQLAAYIDDHLPITALTVGYLGEISMLVLIVHVLLRGRIGKLVAARFDKEYAVYMICSIVLQILLAVAVKSILNAAAKISRRKS